MRPAHLFGLTAVALRIGSRHSNLPNICTTLHQKTGLNPENSLILQLVILTKIGIKKRTGIRFFIPKNQLKHMLVATCSGSWYLRTTSYEIMKANHNVVKVM